MINSLLLRYIEVPAMDNKKQKIINLEKSLKNKESYDLGGLLPKIFTKFAKDLQPKMIAYFESLDDTLFDMAEKAESNQNQTMYFETMRNIRKSRKQMNADFFYSIKSTFQKFKNNSFDYFDPEVGYNPEFKTLSLSLVDEKELDETLAKTNLIDKSEMVYHRHIFAFKKRFSILASGTLLKENQIPISPYVLVNSFAKCIAQLDIEVTLKLIMYKLFERNIMAQLNDTYSHINEFLTNKGIIPEIKYHVGQQGRSANSPISSSPKVAVPNQTNEQVSDGNNRVPNNNIEVTNNPGVIDPNYQLISQLFKHSHQPTDNNNVSNNNAFAHTTTVATPMTNIDMGSMINALTSLQNNIFNKTNTINKSPTEIKDELIKQMHELDSTTIDQKVKQKDEDTIDLVGMLFQFIVDDRNLPDAIQVILAKLQIPYLKIALRDRNLFADKEHPARKLLNKLSVASIGWSSESDKNNLFILKIEQITHKILEVEEYSNKFYLSLLAHFQQFLSKLKKKSDVAQKRSKERTIGQEKIYKAKSQSAQLLVDKMSNISMPVLIRDLLLGEWANVLVLMHLRHGTKSTEYQEKVKFIDLLIQYSQTGTDNKVTEQMIKKVTEIYDAGLKIVAFNPKELSDKLHKLIECLNKIHDINPNKTNDKDVELVDSKKILQLSDLRDKHKIVQYIEEIIEPKNSDTQEDLEEKFLKLADSLKIGTWLEFIKDENDVNVDTIRAKLSWISPITAKYLFVNSRGLKITDKSNIAIASGFKNKTIRILQQVALFDRALSAIANNLNKPNSDTSQNKIKP